jgi:hypothetical protein
VARIIQQVARVLNVEPAEAELVWPKDHSAVHSIRIGAAHYLAATGIDLTSIMHSGGWNDPKMPRCYTRDLAGIGCGSMKMIAGEPSIRTRAQANALNG